MCLSSLVPAVLTLLSLPTSSEILERAAIASGVGKINGTYEIVIQDDAPIGKSKTRVLFDSKFRLRYERLDHVDINLYFDGTDVWTWINGISPRRNGRSFPTPVLLHVWAITGQWALKDSPIRRQLLELKKDHARYRLTTKNGAAAEVTVDTDTGYVSAFKYGDTNIPYSFAKHRTVGPLTIASEHVWKTSKLEILSVQKLRQELTLPKATSRPTIGGAFGKRLSLNSDGCFRYTLCAVNSESSLQFMIDTGANRSIIDEARAKTLSLPSGRSVQVNGIGGANVLKEAICKTVSLGNLKFNNVPVLLLPLDPPSSTTVVDGIIGSDLLGDHVFEFNFRDEFGDLFIHDPVTYKLPQGSSWQKIAFNMGLPCVWAKVGRIEGWFLLDLGLHGEFIINADQSKKSGIDLSNPEPIGVGIGGSYKGVKRNVPHASIGNQIWDNPEVVIEVDSKTKFPNKGVVGSIGIKAMNRLTLILDYKNERFAILRQ